MKKRSSLKTFLQGKNEVDISDPFHIRLKGSRMLSAVCPDMWAHDTWYDESDHNGYWAIDVLSDGTAVTHYYPAYMLCCVISTKATVT
jgi:hypothetical protein